MILLIIQKNYKDLKNGEIEMSILQIKRTLASLYIECFAATLVSYIDIRVIAALPSTYAEFSNPTVFHISKSTKEDANFYNKYLGVELDNSYGVFDKATVDRLKKI